MLGKGHPDMGFEARAEGHGRRDMVLQVRDIGEGALEQNQWEKGTEHGQRGSLFYFLQISWYIGFCAKHEYRLELRVIQLVKLLKL